MATQQDQLLGIIDVAGSEQQIHGSQEGGLRTLMELASFKAFYRRVDEKEARRFQDMGDKSKRVRENSGPSMVITLSKSDWRSLVTIKDTNILMISGLKECTWQLEEAILV